jgi:flavin prenyltransferase
VSRYIVAITGASGVIYGLELAAELLRCEHELHLVISEPAWLVLKQEMEWSGQMSPEQAVRGYLPQGRLFWHANTDIAARIASGSYICDAMVIVPCTMSTLASVANGMSNNLIERAADVMLKEQRQLILVPRETPLSSVHLRNMLTLADLGVAIVPAMPAFYHRPQSVQEIICFVVGKIMDMMRIPHDMYNRYGGPMGD